MHNKMKLDRDKWVIEQMKEKIVGLQDFHVNLYYLNNAGREKYGKLTLTAIQELADGGGLLVISPTLEVEDGAGNTRTIQIEGPARELVEVIKDVIKEVGEYEQRSERFYHALKPEIEPVLRLLTSYACYELVNDSVDSVTGRK